jgi:hypothetical protein
LGRVRLKLATSNYQGETEWNDPNQKSSLLEHVLVDPLTQKTVNAQLVASIISPSSSSSSSSSTTTNSNNNALETVTCELEPAEDSFLELGKSSSDNIPPDVAKWEAGDVLFDSQVSSKDSLPMSIKLVGQKKSVAWFEVVLIEPTMPTTVTTKNPNLYSAVPLALQIQVGGGSWETSLVQSQQLEDGDPDDFISFDFVILWEQFD